VKLELDWSAYRDAGTGDAYADIPRTGGDFARAVAVCINSRQCETDGKGVMCPSHRVTGNPQLSPGGRVRLLKAALNGDEAALHDHRLADAMAVCVACKGCKRECENGIDMAMIKTEYLAQRHRRARPPLRTRLLADLSRQLQYWSCFKGLVRLRNRIPPLARLGERLLGLSAARRLPEPARRSYEQRHPADAVPSEAPDAVGEVVLLLDTFSNQFAPEQAEAARAVLQAAGYRVHVARPDAATPEPDRPLCCGRTHIANGLVDQARREARRMLAVLQPHVAAGRQVIGLEPACLLAIRDDYRFLALGADAEQVADKAILFEEFIAREIAAKRFTPALKPVDTGGQPLLVHGHCHQKAVGAMKAMRKVLRAIPDLEFRFIDAACCGMAGSFGLESEHADMAMQMAEQALLPALREAPDAPVLANGFSCRHQIREGAERPARHLACLLREAMGC